MANKKNNNENLEKEKTVKINRRTTKKNNEITKKEKVVSMEKVDDVIKEKLKKIEESPQKKENSSKVQINFSLFELIVTVIIISLIFLLFGYFYGNKKDKEILKYSVADKEIQTLIEEYNYILENYYGDIEKDKLILGAIKGMLSYLDPYSEVINEDSNNFSVTLEGSYEGVGVGINNDVEGNIVIVTVYPNTPASKAGLKTGDIVKEVNGEKIVDVTSSEFVEMLSNIDDINMLIKRGEETFEAKVKKEMIELESVSAEMHDNKIGYINVSIFANNTDEQFQMALEKLERDGMEKLIIDLRGNTGGHLSSVEKMLYLFLDSTHVIYQTQTKENTIKHYSKGKVDKKYPIVILQNSISASASEIMAATLQEELNAYVIGKASYGKGTVQQLQTVNGIGQYKFTTKKWLTPKGNWIDGVGVQPNLEVSLSDEYLLNPSLETDDQYQAAIEYLKNN